MSTKILVHDYAGHPFQIQLSRELAHRGHQVLHSYAGYNITPHGKLEPNATDSSTLEIRPIFIRKPLLKYNYLKRWSQEREYGSLLSKTLFDFKPDVVLSANTPLDAQFQLLKSSQAIQAKFVFWLQDIISVATQRVLQQKLSYVGKFIGSRYMQIEKNLLRKSDHIVLITDDFKPLVQEWGIKDGCMTTIPNWAPINTIPVCAKDNPWAQKHGLISSFCFMYTGTLGMKHNPAILLELAFQYQENPRVKVVVISEGPGAAWLQKEKLNHKLETLVILPYQSFDDLPNVMATADVLVALLEPDAGTYSVPSKVLTYLCAQRPLLVAVPLENLSAKIVSDNKAGIVVSPKDTPKFLDSADKLVEDKNLRNDLSLNARQYAKNNFIINKIADKFEQILL